MHEDFHREHTAPALAPRSFGLGGAVVLALFWGLARWRGHHPRVWPLIAAAVLAAIAGLVPAVLTPAAKAWMALGKAMSRVTNPILMALAYFVVITPAALVLRAVGWDPLGRRGKRQNSYWIAREPAAPSAASLRDPF